MPRKPTNKHLMVCDWWCWFGSLLGSIRMSFDLPRFSFSNICYKYRRLFESPTPKSQHNQPLPHCHEFPQIPPLVKFTVIFSWLCVLWWQNSVLTYLDSDVRSWLISGLCSKMFTTRSVANLCKYKPTKSFWLSRKWFPEFLNTEMLEEQFPIQPHHDFECSLLLGLFECTSEENAALIIP